ncbi:MAG: Wzt carbohydrate-binding domain-containing protein [Bryobacteraceae bacterium]
MFRNEDGLEAAAPDGTVIGIVGLAGSGKSRLLRAAAKREGSRLIGGDDALDLSAAPVLLLDHALARLDALARERAVMAIDGLRRGGTTVLLVSHDEPLLARIADEIWWLDGGRLAARGDPGEVLRAYRAHVAERLREGARMAPSLREGDGRAEIVNIELLGEGGPGAVWRSGELAEVRATLRFHAAVEDPVIGMLIRTRIGLNVYGTNTELEGLKLGPRKAGDTLTLTFAFRCDLCPERYTITMASHDPDGTRHDWLEDAVAFTVTDTRYTAGVANLRARVAVT